MDDAGVKERAVARGRRIDQRTELAHKARAVGLFKGGGGGAAGVVSGWQGAIAGGAASTNLNVRDFLRRTRGRLKGGAVALRLMVRKGMSGRRIEAPLSRLSSHLHARHKQLL